uniref:ABC transporter substrate-binding protein n=1 Tax=Nocardiopsis sp. CNT312 TaxID=1137268 RepID=UPI00048A6FC0
MLNTAEVDMDEVEQVEVGYDPSVLPRGQVQSLTAFRSNEPFQLEAMGEDYTAWMPEEYDVTGSFGVMATSPDFADANPTVVEDFLRAMSRAFDYCVENGQECVEYAAELAGAEYDVDHNLKVWEAESALVVESTPDGSPYGYIDLALTEAEGSTIVEYGQLEELPELEPLFAPEYLEAVHSDGELVWDE